MLTTSACGARRSDKKGAARTGNYGDPNALLGESPSQKNPGSTTAPAGGSGSRKPSPKTNTSGAGSPDGGNTEISIRDTGNNGARNGRLFLGGDQYTEINIEIDFVAGRQPSQAAIDHLVKIMKQAAPGKKVTLSGGNVIPAQGGNYTGEAIETIGNKLRDTRSEKPRASVWVGYLDGSLPGAAGVAVGGTVCAVFMDTIDELPFPPTTRREIEKTILVQEVFHLLGLVNIGYTSPRPHEDKDHPHHSKNPNSVMYWALMTQESIITFLTNGGAPPTNFDQDDLADLRDLANGTL